MKIRLHYELSIQCTYQKDHWSKLIYCPASNSIIHHNKERNLYASQMSLFLWFYPSDCLQPQQQYMYFVFSQESFIWFWLPGLLMYIWTGALSFSDCRNSSWATTRLDNSSLIYKRKQKRFKSFTSQVGFMLELIFFHFISMYWLGSIAISPPPPTLPSQKRVYPGSIPRCGITCVVGLLLRGFFSG